MSNEELTCAVPGDRIEELAHALTSVVRADEAHHRDVNHGFSGGEQSLDGRKVPRFVAAFERIVDDIFDYFLGDVDRGRTVIGIEAGAHFLFAVAIITTVGCGKRLLNHFLYYIFRFHEISQYVVGIG